VKMKKVKLLIVFNLILCSLFGQSYISYYTLCNKADKQIYLEENKLALNILEEAFSKVKYVHALQYEKASKCAMKIKDFQKGYFYAKKSILNGNTRKFWNNKKMKGFKESEYYQLLKDSMPYFKEIHLNSINKGYKQIIDSLYFIDQNVIRNVKHVKGDYNLEHLKIPKNKYDLDTLVFQELLVSIEKYGFPSEENIGLEGYEKALIIVHHNFRKKTSEPYHSIVINAVFNGGYLPADFEGMYEQYNMWHKNKTFFSTFDKDLSASNLQRINANRLKYGLKDLSAFKLKRKGLNMKNRW